MFEARVQAGQTDLEIEVRLLDDEGSPVDVSGATAKTILVRPPSGDPFELMASYRTDGGDGVIYTDFDSVLVDPGRCEVQAVVELLGARIRSRVGAFMVYPNLGFHTDFGF
jgi:hypothetical protein